MRPIYTNLVGVTTDKGHLNRNPMTAEKQSLPMDIKKIEGLQLFDFVEDLILSSSWVFVSVCQNKKS